MFLHVSSTRPFDFSSDLYMAAPHGKASLQSTLSDLYVHRMESAVWLRESCAHTSPLAYSRKVDRKTLQP